MHLISSHLVIHIGHDPIHHIDDGEERHDTDQSAIAIAHAHARTHYFALRLGEIPVALCGGDAEEAHVFPDQVQVRTTQVGALLVWLDARVPGGGKDI